MAILPFGYPVRAVGRGKKQRKPLREVAHLERYGRPFDVDDPIPKDERR